MSVSGNETRISENQMITTFHWKSWEDVEPELENEPIYVSAIEEDGTISIDTIWLHDKDPLLYNLFRNSMAEYTRSNSVWWTHWCYHRDFEIEK